MSAWFGRTVLVISPTPTAPLDYGHRRYICNGLRRLMGHGARIIFLLYPSEDDWRGMAPLDSLREMQAQWDAVYVSPVSRPLHTAPLGSHHHRDEWWDEALGTMVRWIVATHAIDVCMVYYAWLGKAFEYCPEGVFKVLVAVDKFAGRREMLEANGVAPEYFYLTEAEERAALLRADVVWAIKEDEAAYFTRISGRSSLVFPHVERPELAQGCVGPRQDMVRFGFMGARNSVNLRNYEMFFALLDRVVRRHLLPARFILAGSMCDLIPPDRHPYLERLGRVEMIEDFYRACDVVVVPMSFSTGLKIKVGEAIGYGKAVIAHAHAFEGYRPSHRLHAVESFASLCQAIIDIIDRPELIDELELAALRTRDETERRAEACVVATEQISAGRRFVMLVPADLLDQRLVVDHVVAVCSHVGYIERPRVHVTGDAASVPAATWRRIGAHARLSADPIADMGARDQPRFQSVSFQTQSRLRAGGCGVLYALRFDDDVAAWLGQAEDCLLRLEEWGGPGGDELAGSMDRLRDADPEAASIIVIGSAQAEARLRRLGLDLRHVRIALLRNAAPSLVQQQLATQPRRGVCLLGAGARPELIRGLLSSPGFRARWGAEPRQLVLSETEQRRLIAQGGDWPEWLGGVSVVTPQDLLTAWQERGHGPDLVAQLGPDDEARFAWLHEVCGRAELPCLCLSSGARALSGLNALFSLRYVSTATRTQREAMRWEGDRGWAWLWRLVKYRVMS